MAEKRMFTKKVTNSDAFLDMPLSAQALYFHLNMEADDDGFNGSPKKTQRMIRASDDDLKLLFVKGFIIPFESGVVVIKHWRLHNYIQKDRYKETVYTEEKKLLEVQENKTYSLMYPECIQDVSEMDPQIRLDKTRLDKNSINNNIIIAEADDCVDKPNLEEEFEILWSMYPNKQGKAKSLEHYIKSRTKEKVEYDIILEGLKKYLVYCEQNKDWYRPKNGSTWFNYKNKCWKDEYEIKENNTNNSNETNYIITEDGAIKLI